LILLRSRVLLLPGGRISGIENGINILTVKITEYALKDE